MEKRRSTKAATNAPGRASVHSRAAEHAAGIDPDGSAVRRVAELSEANRLLAESCSGLTSGADLDDFLESMVRTLARRLGASQAGLFAHDAVSGTLVLRVLYDGGRVRRGRSGAVVPIFAGPFRTDVNAAWSEAVRAGGHFLTEAQNPRAREHLWPGLADWFRGAGITEAGLQALIVGDEPVGALGIAWSDGRKLRTADCPQIEALGQQAAAALQMVKLADQARDATIVRERGRAAHHRAAERSRANDVLQRSTALLVRQDDPIAFLESVLREATFSSDALGAGVIRHDAAADTLEMIAWVRDGQRIDIQSDPRMTMWRTAFRCDVFRGWKCTLNDEVLWFENDAVGEWPKAHDWHRSMGHRMVAAIPLIVSGSPLGFLGLCFGEVVRPTQSIIDRARALAGHAALALQLTRLSDEVRREASVAAALAERNRIARDLHDTLAQGFTGILAQLGVIEGAMAAKGADSDGQACHALSRAVDLARQSLVEARRSVGTLRDDSASDPGGDRPGLEEILRPIVAALTTGTHLRARVEVESPLPAIPAPQEETLRRIAQESLTNALKHAGPNATEFVLRLGCQNGRVYLIARDDGRGFRVDEQADHSEGFGLIGMRERAALAGGTMTVRSAPAQGVEVTVELPLSTNGTR